MLLQLASLAWGAIQVVIGFNLVFPVLLAAWAGLRKALGTHSLPDKEPADLTIQEPDYALIVTAYQYTDTLPAVVSSLLNLNYSNYLIYVVADNCEVEEDFLKHDKVVLLRPETVLASNTRSHFFAIKNFKRDHQRITIIDSDNLVDPAYLNELNKLFARGFEAVQGLREAKNLDTTVARLDAARDIYYHYFDGKLLFKAGSSATLAGSGMAFTTRVYKECLEDKDISGAGFDKILQFELVKRAYRIAFAPQAIVYDEKTSRPEQLVNQRARWINTWFKYFGFGFLLWGKGIAKGNWNQLLFGTVLLRPPLFIFLILSALMAMANLFINPLITLIWVAAFACFIGGFMLALNRSETDRRIYQALTGIPGFIFFQLKGLANAARANQRSVATRHYHQELVREGIGQETKEFDHENRTAG